MNEHPKTCDCIVCHFPFMTNSVVEDTAPVLLMESYTNSVRAEAQFFGLTQPRLTHWASEAMKKCPRLAWFRAHGTAPTNVGYSEDVMEKGSETEARTIDLYRMYGELLGQRVYVGESIYVTILEPTLERPITGKIDLLIVEDDKWVPVEIKEVKDFGGSGYCFNCKHYVRGDPEAWKKFKPTVEHTAQLMLYMHAYHDKIVLNRSFADYGYLYYRNRNTAAHLRFKIIYSPELVKHIFDFFREQEKVYALPEAPSVPEDFKQERYPCTWQVGETTVRCAFFDRCYKEDSK